MKKIFVIIMVICLFFGACGTDSNDNFDDLKAQNEALQKQLDDLKNNETDITDSIAVIEMNTESPPEIDNSPKNFRNVNWNMTKEQIKSLENKNPDIDSDDSLIYNDVIVAEIQCTINYTFNKSGQLYSVIYTFDKTLSNDYIPNYERLRNEITNKYGEHTRGGEIWHDDLFKQPSKLFDSSDDYIIAVSIGHLEYIDSWELENMNISMSLIGYDYDILLTVMFNSDISNDNHLIENKTFIVAESVNASGEQAGYEVLDMLGEVGYEFYNNGKMKAYGNKNNGEYYINEGIYKLKNNVLTIDIGETLSTATFLNGDRLKFNTNDGGYMIFVEKETAKKEREAYNQILKEKFQNLIKIDAIYPSKPNSVGGVNLYITWSNLSEKTIKYITFYIQPINTVDDVVKCDLRGHSEFRGVSTGPFATGDGKSADTYYWENSWYNNTIYYVELLKIEIEYMDGTKETITKNELKYLSITYFSNGILSTNSNSDSATNTNTTKKPITEENIVWWHDIAGN